MAAQRSRSALETFAYPYPGRSQKRTVRGRAAGVGRYATSKNCRARVRPGVLETRASPLRRVSAFSIEDLPTFERPTNAISGAGPRGHSAGRVAVRANSAETTWSGMDQGPFFGGAGRFAGAAGAGGGGSFAWWMSATFRAYSNFTRLGVASVWQARQVFSPGSWRPSARDSSSSRITYGAA